MKLLSSKLTKLTSILSDLKYHDGDSIGAQLSVTRSAIWKSIKKLEEYGVKINSVKNKGYALSEPLLLLDKDFITQAIANPNIDIEILENIDSTNNYLRKNTTCSSQRKICIAESQTTAKGRMGKSWHSPFGQNIYISYAYCFKKDISELNGLSLVVSMAALAAIKEVVTDKNLMLKWPNDGIYEKQKFMGNLVEIQSEAYGESLAIIGLGINVNMLNADLEEITQSWTSLRKITGDYIDRNILLVALIHNLNMYLERFAKYGLQEFISEWQELDSLYDQKIALNNNEYIGIAKGINEQGNLLLELANGEIRAFAAGETSICKK